MENNDAVFIFKKDLIDLETIEEHSIHEDEVPCLLYGNTGINSGFCIYTGEHFIWLNCQTPEEAVKVSDTIVSFEPVYK
ncbi:hypothetical protein [Tenacibaculum sp. C7A-26P2]|uniref:hypothetical protein n=1 Tax=Tenacibaculum sp. C7A-26P2 TaxID=3447504 RepID=UPI003F86A33D